MDESAKPLHAYEEMPADHVEAMDTREGGLIDGVYWIGWAELIADLHKNFPFAEKDTEMLWQVAQYNTVSFVFIYLYLNAFVHSSDIYMCNVCHIAIFTLLLNIFSYHGYIWVDTG